MKTSKNLITLVFVALSVVALAAPAPKKESIEVMESKHKNVFVFKAEKSVQGSDVQVYSSTGELIISKKLSGSKMAIDFSDVNFGTYTIKVIKDGSVQELSYQKKSCIERGSEIRYQSGLI